jgi:lysophospholipase L1-like esterase
MKAILCYGDSNTCGSILGTEERFAKYERYPGVLKIKLTSHPNGQLTVLPEKNVHH